MTAAAKKMPVEQDSAFADELKPGSRLMHGQYVIEEFLNSGGFGITYLATDSLQRRVVIKECFPGSFCRRSDTAVGARSRAHQVEFRSIVKLFVQEAFSLAKLKHPNIVGVHQVFEDNDTAYMAMDFIDGFDLMETLEGEANRLSPEQMIEILEKILSAVGFIHSQDVLHRDISPDNILIDKSTGNPVLIDFGAAREEVSKASRVLSELRVVKDGYSPQEFYISGSVQGPSSDLYALAASFYHLISGKTPPSSQVRLSAIASQEPDPYQPIRGTVAGYSEAFLAAIDKSMSIFPKDRLQSADEWLAMIDPESKLKLPSGRTKSRFTRPLTNSATAAAAEAPKPNRVMSLLASSVAVIGIGFGLNFYIKHNFPPKQDNTIAAAVVAKDPKPNLSVALGTVAKAPSESASKQVPEAPAPASAATPEKVTVAPAQAALKAPATDTVAVGSATAVTQKESPASVAATGNVAPAIAVPTASVAAKVSAQTPAKAVEPATRTSALPAAKAPAPAVPVTKAEPAKAPPAAVAATEEPKTTPLSPAPAANPAPASDVVGVAPRVAVAVAPKAAEASVPTLVAQNTSQYMTVRLPFDGTKGANNVIAKLGATAPVWMEQGQRIVEINGVAVKASDDLAKVISTTMDYSGKKEAKITFAVETPGGSGVVTKDQSLPVVQIIVLKNGLEFEVFDYEGEPRTVVKTVPDNLAGVDLKTGDVLLADMSNTIPFSETHTFLDVVTREVNEEAETISVAVERGPTRIVISLPLKSAS